MILPSTTLPMKVKSPVGWNYVTFSCTLLALGKVPRFHMLPPIAHRTMLRCHDPLSIHSIYRLVAFFERKKKTLHCIVLKHLVVSF